MERAELPQGVGPLDEATLRPMRTLVTSKLVAMLVLAVAAVGAGVLLAPQVGTGMGWAPRVSATVTAVEPLPAGDTASGARCVRENVHVAWGSGHTGSYVTCGSAGAADSAGASDSAADAGSAASPAVGDVITVRAVAGWQTVVIGGRGPNAVLVVMLLAVLVIGVGGAVRYVRQRRVLDSLRSRAVAADGLDAERVALAMAFDALSLGRGKRAMLRLRFADRDLRPIRLQIPGAHPESMQWRDVTVYPAGRTRAGGRTGPYVLRTRAGGLLVASGGSIRTAAGPRAARGGACGGLGR